MLWIWSTPKFVVSGKELTCNQWHSCTLYQNEITYRLEILEGSYIFKLMYNIVKTESIGLFMNLFTWI